MQSLEELQRHLDFCKNNAEICLRQSKALKEKAERHAEVARKKQLTDKHRRMSGASLASLPDEEKTTLMLRNLPNDYKGELLLQLLNKKGLQGRYDFVYLPMDFKRKSGLGYAFVNMCTHDDACRAMSLLKGFNKWDSVAKGSMKVLSVDWGADQGLEKHLDRYRNSPVMHQDVEESYKPMYFSDGVQKEFPPPTKRVRPPRAKARAKDRE